jgi:hypothetical protein
LIDKGLLYDTSILDVERVNNSDSNNALETGDGNSINERLIIPDEDTLSQMVTARLDLPISKNIMNHNFKQSIVKKCWEDQLRFKGIMQVAIVFRIRKII